MARNLDDTSLVTLGVGAASLALVVLLRRFAPAVPGAAAGEGPGIRTYRSLDEAIEAVRPAAGGPVNGSPGAGPDGTGGT